MYWLNEGLCSSLLVESIANVRKIMVRQGIGHSEVLVVISSTSQ